MSNDYQKVCELEASGNVCESVVLKVKLPQCRAILGGGCHCFIWCHADADDESNTCGGGCHDSASSLSPPMLIIVDDHT